MALIACIAAVRALGDGRGEVLDPAAAARIAAIVHPRARARSRAAAILARHALSRCLGGAPRDHVVERDVDGRPVHAGGAAISLSHSGDWVAAAVATDGAVGVDLETHRRGRNVSAIADAYFTAAEAQWLRGRPTDAFYHLWVLKEAYLKALGHGLAGGLTRLECTAENGQITGRVQDSRPVGLAVVEGPDWYGALALPGRDDPDVRWLEFDGSKWHAASVKTVASGRITPNAVR